MDYEVVHRKDSVTGAELAANAGRLVAVDDKVVKCSRELDIRFVLPRDARAPAAWITGSPASLKLAYTGQPLQLDLLLDIGRFVYERLMTLLQEGLQQGGETNPAGAWRLDFPIAVNTHFGTTERVFEKLTYYAGLRSLDTVQSDRIAKGLSATWPLNAQMDNSRFQPILDRLSLVLADHQRDYRERNPIETSNAPPPQVWRGVEGL